MRLGVLAATALAAALLQTPPNPFAAAGLDNPESVIAFLSDLKQAVAADDPGAIADLASFPLQVSTRKTRQRLRSSADFRKMYSRVFDACLKRVVAATTIEDLSASWRGVMLGRGAIWFGVEPDKTLRIFAINGPIEGEPLCKTE